QGQSRLLVAAVASMAVLGIWTYFFSPSKPADNTNANSAVAASDANANVAAAPSPVQTASPAPGSSSAPAQDVAQPPVDSTPNRSVTIKSPLYEVTIDSKGALATSWIVLRNKSDKSDYAIYADGSTETDQKPVQLI